MILPWLDANTFTLLLVLTMKEAFLSSWPPAALLVLLYCFCRCTVSHIGELV